MRYSSTIHNLRLYRQDGNAAGTDTVNLWPTLAFHNGVLDLGSGNVIVPNLAAINGSALMVINPSGGTDLEKVGLNKFYWEAPEVSGAGATPLADWVYTVIRGTVVFDGKTYTSGDMFVGDGTNTTATTDGAVIAKYAPLAYATATCCGGEAAAFKLVHLERGDEGEWSITAPNSYVPTTPYGWVAS